MIRLLIGCLFLAEAGLLSRADSGDAAGPLTISQPPQNTALEYGPPVTLNCTASGPNERVIWTEFATTQNGNQISDNWQLLPGHPNYARYELIHDNSTRNYDLVISPSIMADGGTYRCYDVSDSSAPVFAQLVMLGGPPNCTTNIPPDGYVLEGRYYTIECTVDYRGNAAPVMTWTGPEEWRGSWGQVSTTSNTTVWSGVNMNMTRFFDMQTFSVLANFTRDGFTFPNSATNVPTWNYTIQWPEWSELHVLWLPQRLYVAPEQPSYEIGDVLTCGCDSNPESRFFWQNMVTNEVWEDFRLVASDRLVGTTLMRCNANNALGAADLFINITVNPRTTSSTPTTTTTTTPPPAEGDCNDLTGRWRATRPSIVDLCIEINSQTGQVIGLMRNATDPYFIEVRGGVTPYQFDEIGFAGVWPVNIGTQAFTGVCSNCFGTEFLQVTAIGRVIGDFNTCTDFGPLRLFQFYEFTRSGPPCRGLFQEYGIEL